MSLDYTFTQRSKTLTYILMGVGLLAFVLGFITDTAPEGVAAEDYHHNRFWANFLINSFFFMAIGLAATFFMAMQYAAEASWATVLKRVFEAVSTFLPVGAILLAIVFLMGTLGVHHLYHWMDPEVIDPNSHHYDAIIASKSPYLNQGFFWLRAIVFLGVWILFQRGFRKRSLEEDLTGGKEIHRKNITKAAIFLVFFGFTSSVAAWDWLMSIDTHWFSTLFGWYVFSGMWISALIMITLITLHLKKRGHLKNVNEHHIHDLGKWMFAVSFLWTYLWFSQFMLIWYANIPEEVTYFWQRIEEFKGLMWTTFFINFAFPMLIFMSRDAKRSYSLLTGVGVIIFIFHWVDVYLMVTPATVGGAQASIGPMEVGMFLGFLGLFLHVVLKSLTKAPLEIQKHPYLEESIHFEQ